MRGFRLRINLFHSGIVEVCIHPLFYLILCFNALCTLVIAYQCYRRNNNVTTHKDSQYPGNDFSWFYRYFFN